MERIELRSHVTAGLAIGGKVLSKPFRNHSHSTWEDGVVFSRRQVPNTAK